MFRFLKVIPALAVFIFVSTSISATPAEEKFSSRAAAIILAINMSTYNQHMKQLSEKLSKATTTERKALVTEQLENMIDYVEISDREAQTLANFVLGNSSHRKMMEDFTGVYSPEEILTLKREIITQINSQKIQRVVPEKIYEPDYAIANGYVFHSVESK